MDKVSCLHLTTMVWPYNHLNVFFWMSAYHCWCVGVHILARRLNLNELICIRRMEMSPPAALAASPLPRQIEQTRRTCETFTRNIVHAFLVGMAKGRANQILSVLYTSDLIGLCIAFHLMLITSQHRPNPVHMCASVLHVVGGRTHIRNMKDNINWGIMGSIRSATLGMIQNVHFRSHTVKWCRSIEHLKRRGSEPECRFDLHDSRNYNIRLILIILSILCVWHVLICIGQSYVCVCVCDKTLPRTFNEEQSLMKICIKFMRVCAKHFRKDIYTFDYA